MKSNLKSKLIKTFTLLSLVFMAFPLTSRKSSESVLKSYSTEHQIENISVKLKDGNGGSMDYSKAYLAADTEYRFEVSLSADISDEPLSGISSVEILKGDEVSEYTIESANTSDISIASDLIEIKYTNLKDTSELTSSFTICFKLSEETDYLDELFKIYVQGTDNTYLNNNFFFPYTISDAISSRLGYKSEASYTYFTLGEAPQSHVTSKALIKKLNNVSSVDGDGYYELDGNKYAKFDSVGTSGQYFNGDAVTTGVNYYKVEPILWRVLRTDGNKYTLMSEYSLDLLPTTSKSEFEGKYLKKYFSKEELKQISTKAISKYTDVFTKDYNLATEQSRQCIPSDYSLARGVEQNSNGGCYYIYPKAWDDTNNPGLYQTSSTAYGYRPIITVAKEGYIYRNSAEATGCCSVFFGILTIASIVFSLVKDYCRSSSESFKISTIFIPVSIVLTITYLLLLFLTALNGWLFLFFITAASAEATVSFILMF